ncbi:MAG: PKD domain-containing protein [Vicingaceae bacterium]|nr:PKD domain-containing protein [Vicingaceae bacterium]
MSDFNKIIKEKLDQFEVPYNDAHWAEMEGKLNSIRSTKIKKNVFSVAAVITILSAIAYFIIPNENTISNNNPIVETNKTEEVSQNNSSSKELNQSNKKIAVNENKETNNTKINIVENENNEISTTTDNNNVEENNITKTINSSTTNSNHNEKVKVISDFIVYNNKVCLDEVVSFEAMENDRPVSYLWNFGDGTISHKKNPNHIYKNDGVYSITLTIIDKESGTEHTSIQRDVVTILSKPNVEYTYIEESTKHDDNKLKYPYTTFKVKSFKKGYSYEWDLGNGETPTGNVAKTIHKKADNYLVKLTVKNVEGCVTSSSKNISIKNNFTLYAPNAIRHNPDNPENGVFMVKALIEWDISFEMIITDKAGKVIYKTTDKNQGWNGKLNNTGQQMEEGLYFWKIVTKDAEFNSHYHQGEIHLKK